MTREYTLPIPRSWKYILEIPAGRSQVPEGHTAKAYSPSPADMDRFYHVDLEGEEGPSDESYHAQPRLIPTTRAGRHWSTRLRISLYGWDRCGEFWIQTRTMARLPDPPQVPFDGARLQLSPRPRSFFTHQSLSYSA